MTSELQFRHRPPKNQLAQIERQYKTMRLEQGQQASRVKSRERITYIPEQAQPFDIPQRLQSLPSRK
jgi:hypothetical protein